MLQIAPSVHTETPGASKHSSLAHSCYTDRNSLKRRNSQQDSTSAYKKPAKNQVQSMLNKLNSSEITLTPLKKKNSLENKQLYKEDLVEDDRIPAKDIINSNKKVPSIKKESNDNPKGKTIVLDFFSEPTNKRISFTENNKTESSSSAFMKSNTDADSDIKNDNVAVNKEKIRVLDTNSINDLNKSNEVTEEKLENTLCLKDVTIEQKLTKTTPKILKSKTNSKISAAKDFLKNASSKRVLETQEPKTDEFQDLNEPIFNNYQRQRNISCSNDTDPELNFDNYTPEPLGHFIDEEAFNATSPLDFNIGLGDDFLENENKDEPYYSMGFPNPPGENRCWLNATLHALFALPLLNKLDSFEFTECSKLINTLVDLQINWRKGHVEKHEVYQNIETLKQELKVLDESYPSERQQDVSEFLTIFFSYIKNDFDKILKKTLNKKDEIENVPSNQQDPLRKSQSNVNISEANKRLPLADISASAGQHGNNQVVASNSQQQTETKSNKNEPTENSENPMDQYFSLYMVENLTCEGCLKNRQQKIENLMLFVDLPTQDFGTINLTDSIDKTFATEKRNLTCEACKHTVHSMTTKFTKFPKILMVQVKRYEMTSDGEINKKCTSVNIPKSLKLDSSMIIQQDSEQSAEYEPICIISHVGGSMDCGHYTSYVKYSDQWYYYNDLDVKKISTEQALKSAQRTAYLIIFKDIKLNEDFC